MAIVRGSRGPTGAGATIALSDATPAALGVAAAGVSTDASRADHVHALPTGFASGATTAEPMTGAGWTDTPGTGVTVAWASSKLTFDAAAGSTAEAFAARDSTPLGPSSSQWDLCARIQATAGTGGSERAGVLVQYRVDSSNWVLMGVTNTGRVLMYSYISASFTDHGFVSGPSTAQLGAGQLWLRLTRTVDGAFVAWWGIGTAGAIPTAWKRTHRVDLPTAVLALGTPPIVLSAGHLGFGALAAQWTVDVLAIRTTWQGSL